jgi:hypothetical protein
MGSGAEEDPIEPPPLSTSSRERTDALVEHGEPRCLGTSELDRHVPERFEAFSELASKARELAVTDRLPASLLEELYMKLDPAVIAIVGDPAPRSR